MNGYKRSNKLLKRFIKKEAFKCHANVNTRIKWLLSQSGQEPYLHLFQYKKDTKKMFIIEANIFVMGEMIQNEEMLLPFSALFFIHILTPL
jgi:hypothetical protein